MKSLITKATLGLAMAATALTVSAPAQAQRYGGGYYRGHDNTGTAVVAGIAGLAIGAALASNSDRGRTYYVDNGYGYPGYAPYYNGYYANGYNGYYVDNGYYRHYRHHDRDDRGYRGYEHRGGYRDGYGGGYYRR